MREYKITTMQQFNNITPLIVIIEDTFFLIMSINSVAQIFHQIVR